jgi:iron complex outermembrane receptor protein
VSGSLSRTGRESLLGLADDGVALRPLDQRSRALTGNINLALNARFEGWLVTFFGNFDHDRRRTLTDRVDPDEPATIGRSRTVATTRAAHAELVASGPLFKLPAGPVRASIGGRVARDSISGSTRFLGTTTRDRYVQRSHQVSAGIDVAIASRDKGFLQALGELSASAELTRTHVSGFGSFTNQTYSFQWQPVPRGRLFGSITTRRTPPAVGLVNDPIIERPGVRYFDPLRDETVDITEISGGNPDLGPQRGENRRLSLSMKPFLRLALQLYADYRGIRNRDIISALPPASELIFVAFPERFIRDSNGVLTIVDVRPVSFARLSEDQLRYGFNLNLPLAGEASRGRPMLQLRAAHGLLLNSELLIRPGVDSVDLLSREAIGLSGGSRIRHQFDFTVAYAERGVGVRLTGQHRGVSHLNLVSNETSDVLRFSPITTFSLRAFAEGQLLLPTVDWLKGSRFTLSVFNLTNQRQVVRDSSGATPLLYQRAYRDPLGRTVELEFRKAF